MNSGFTDQFFIGNRERLRQLFTGTAPIIFTANGQLQKSSDNPYRFHQDPSFWYLTGLNDPDLILVMDKGREYLIIPEQSTIVERFDGKLEHEHMAAVSGIETIVGEKEGWKLLAGRLKRAKHVATLAANPAYNEHYGMYSNPARARLIRRLRTLNADIELLDLRQHLMRMRMIKQPEELVAIQKAVDITLDTLRDITKPAKLQKYTHEYEIEAALAAGFRKRGADGNSFDSIVAGGPRACTIHYMENNAPLADNELIVLDVGAQYSHYAADITRTVVRGKASKRQRAVVQAVDDVVTYGLQYLKPGTTFRAAEEALTMFMGEKLRELGLIRTIDKESIRKYYPHAPHFLGLDVHDVGDYEIPLEPGMVLTCEPGIYIPEEGIGVRLEEDIVITEKANMVLSARLPRVLV